MLSLVVIQICMDKQQLNDLDGLQRNKQSRGAVLNQLTAWIVSVYEASRSLHRAGGWLRWESLGWCRLIANGDLAVHEHGQEPAMSFSRMPIFNGPVIFMWLSG